MRNVRFHRPAISRKLLFSAVWVFLCTCILYECGPESIEEPAEYRTATHVTLNWNQLLLDLERQTPGYRPPVSGRMFAYVEMSAYEAALPALDGYVSMENFCHGYARTPFPHPAGQFFLPASVNAAYATILRDFFSSAPPALLKQIDRLESENRAAFPEKTGGGAVQVSESFGRAVAENVWQWSKTDRAGHEGNLKNFDAGYAPPRCSGCWQPTGSARMSALLPHWGDVRAFVVRPGEFQEKPPVPFEEVPGSAFYTEAMEVFSVSQPLSRENHWIAELWSDDLPGLTISPAGRWISIANQALSKARTPFPDMIETYLKSALALCDAGIVVWSVKYRYNVERPESYIRRVIQADWSPLHDSPSFPSYPSGHSAFGAAVAEVLSAELGDHFQLTDRTHENRQEFAGKSRSYDSFADMAKENAASRVLLGVHYRMDCEEGMRLGKLIGQKIAGLPLKQKESVTVRQ